MALTRVLLVDNGSLVPAATLALRRLAQEVGHLIGQPVHPVSVLHSHKISPEVLDGKPAQIFAEAVTQAQADQMQQLLVLPLFFGPSLALTEFLPEVFAAHAGPGMQLKIADPLYDASGDLKSMFIDQLRASGWRRGETQVLLCDHGSPQPSVTAVRDTLAAEIRQALQLSPQELIACSMERRPEATYDFNEPLLATALTKVSGDVIILMQFLLPGRHAGAQGDVAQIATQHASAQTHWRLSPLLGQHPKLPELLAKRYAKACKH